MSTSTHTAATPHTAADDYRPASMPRIREIIGEPPRFIVEKKAPQLGEFARRFIAHSTFAVIATVDSSGQVNASPRGDPPGSVRVLDPWTLALPDRPGNKGIDSFRNIVANPGMGVLFLVPGLREMLHVNGQAFVTDDPDLLDRLGVDGRPALLATILRVRQVFYQCGKALIRSGMWDPDLALADALLLDGSFYGLAGAEQGQKGHDVGVVLGEFADEADDHYANELY